MRVRGRGAGWVPEQGQGHQHAMTESEVRFAGVRLCSATAQPRRLGPIRLWQLPRAVGQGRGRLTRLSTVFVLSFA